MRTVFVLFDSLNRRALSCYGGRWLTPNFTRLAQRAVTFDQHYVGSLPCMPARRDIHTGRLNFLHRSWGPLEPFDLSFAELLADAGTYTHLITDHYHYWEDGGATYHNRYNSFEFERGQEWDRYHALVDVEPLNLRERYHPLQLDRDGERGTRTQGLINREFLEQEEDRSIARCFADCRRFLDRNRDTDRWLLQLECFDPHEPFSAPVRFRAHYPTAYVGPVLDWPRYQRVQENCEEVSEIRANYAALVTMCDEYLGTLLDYFDRHELWRDTALIVTTDHGYMLAEHDWWAKSRMPCYDEIAHIPLLIHDPRVPLEAGSRRTALTQTIDLMPTLLALNGQGAPDTVEGHDLGPILRSDEPVREAALYGRFGAATNVTDGRYTYFRYPGDMDAQPLWEYTLMPTHPRSRFLREEFDGATLQRSFAFMRGFPALKLPARLTRNAGQGARIEDADTALFDLETDPAQAQPINAADIEYRLVAQMASLMRANEAPPEAFMRLGLAVHSAAPAQSGTR